MIFILCAFLYHDGRLLHDERLRHDRFLDELFLSFHHDLTLSFAVVQALLLHLASRSFWSVVSAFFPLASLVLFSRRLIFSLQLSLFTDLYPKLSYFCFHCSMIYGERGLRMKRLCMRMAFYLLFSFLLTDRFTCMRGFSFKGFRSIWQQHRSKKIQLMSSRSVSLGLFYSYIFASLTIVCLSDNCLPLYMCISPHCDVSRM